MDPFGVRFETPIEVRHEGKTVSIKEAKLSYVPGLHADFAPYLQSAGTETSGSLIGSVLELYEDFYVNGQRQVLEGPVYSEYEDVSYYNRRPNGDYSFHLESYGVLKI